MMKKMFIMVLKVFGAIVLILVTAIVVLLIAAPFVNDHVAKKTLEELSDLPLPENTEYIESVYRAEKVCSALTLLQGYMWKFMDLKRLTAIH